MTKRSAMITAAVLGFATMLFIAPPQAAAGSSRNSGGGYGVGTAVTITKNAAPYAMAAGSWARNHKDGYTYRDNVEASKKWMEHPVRNTVEDVGNYRRK